MTMSFRGGVHPNDCKGYSAGKAIETAPVPAKVIIPTRQHIGAPCSPIVKVGDLVKKRPGHCRNTGFCFQSYPCVYFW